MHENEIITLNRDVDALLIPSGARIFLQRGTEATITQSLGGSFTVNIYGNLARIDSKDADALGKPVQMQLSEDALETSTLEDLIWTQMRTCYDPEIPVNIVDLGLIYDCSIIEISAKCHRVIIKMTLTAPGCGMGPTIAAEVKAKVECVPHVVEAEIDIVFDPPWDHSLMSEAAKLELGMFY
ncbi:MAG: putative Fe-S cluster assembly protein SufT [Gammaproteobacteria bacterium]|nr:putative Fe-S cluster assembly protein SufT [Gammaproteobacteria bacterium]